VTLPVTDATKAGKIVDALLRAEEDGSWTATEKDGRPLFFEAIRCQLYRDHSYDRFVLIGF